jgi:putative phosphoesterase
LNLKLGIISDSHKKLGRAKKGIDKLLSEGVDFIIHAGDIVRIEILEYLEKIDKDYIAVLGNNDYHLLEFQNQFNLVQEPHYFTIGHVKIKLMHQPYYLTPEDIDIAIYGHTHIPQSQLHEKTLFLNSGEVCARDGFFSQIATIDVIDKGFIVKNFSRQVKNQIWNEKKFEYFF